MEVFQTPRLDKTGQATDIWTDNTFQIKSGSSLPPTEEIWSKILQEVITKSTNFAQGSVIIVGEDQSGKSSLVSRISKSQSKTNQNMPSSVLEHSFIKVHVDPDSSYHYQLGGIKDGLLGPTDSDVLSLWTLDGKPEVASLLQFAFPLHLDKCVLILCASLDRPGHVLPDLERWFCLFCEQVNQHYKPEEINRSKNSQIRFWQEYVEPIESSLQRSIVADGIDGAPSFDSSLLPPPPEGGILDENCGASVIVVITKSDEYTNIAQDHLDKLQYHVRQFCLRHGAALIYTSSKRHSNAKDAKDNINFLSKYLVHRIYSLPFTIPAQIVDYGLFFIPSGWDSQQKIGILKEKLSDTKPLFISQQHDDCFIPQKNADIVEVDDEQRFLSKLSNMPNNLSPRSDNELKPVAAGAQGEMTDLASFFNSLLKKNTGD